MVTWPDRREVATGDGRAFPEPDGDAMAVLDAEGRIRVEGAAAPIPPPAAGQVRTLAWDGADALLAVTGTHALQSSFNPGPTLLPVPAEGVTAQRFGAYPAQGMALWRLPLRGEPRRLAVGTGIEDLSQPVSLGADGVAFTLYRYPTFGTACVQRILRVTRNGGPPVDAFPHLPGSTTALTPSPDGRRLALLHSDLEPFFPFWYRLAMADRAGRVTYPLPHALRLSAEPPVWSPDGRWVAVTAFDGIRVGVVIADVQRPGGWRWLCPAGGACRNVALAPGGQKALAIWESPGVPAALHLVDGQAYTPIEPVAETDPAAHCRLLRWSVGDADFEGLLAVPDGGGPPWPLVVDVHGGPVNGLTAGRNERLLRWCAAGFAGLAPDYRSSGIAGRAAMESAFRAGSADSGDILAAVDTVVRERLVDPTRLYLFGSSFGASLVNDIITRDNRFRAAVEWEGGADARLRFLLGWGGGGFEFPRRYLGGNPWQVPERYDAASPITRVAQVRTPLLLLHGDHDTAEAICWYTALREQGAEADLIFYRGEGHGLGRSENDEDVYARSVAWFLGH